MVSFSFVSPSILNSTARQQLAQPNSLASASPSTPAATKFNPAEADPKINSDVTQISIRDIDLLPRQEPKSAATESVTVSSSIGRKSSSNGLTAEEAISVYQKVAQYL